MNNEFSIIFFDGHCNLCNGFVDFVIRHDKARNFKVASLQGETAKELLPSFHIQDLSSVVLLKKGEIFTKTNAVLRITSKLSLILKPILILLFVPSIIRDPIYNFIAANRYQFFGKNDSCRLPTKEERSYFLP